MFLCEPVTDSMDTSHKMRTTPGLGGLSGRQFCRPIARKVLKGGKIAFKGAVYLLGGDRGVRYAKSY